MNRSLFLAASRVVRHLPNRPKKVRAVVAYRLASRACRGTAIVDAGKGVRMEVDLGDWTHRLYVLGELDQSRIEWLSRMTPPDGLFVDVGANIGLYTCAMANHLRDGGAVIAVEPFEASVQRLERNLALNSQTNTVVVKAAASNSPGTLPLFEPPSRGAPSSGHLRVVDPGGWVKVGSTPKIRLDQVLGERQVDTLKIDVEGHEIAVIEGLGSVVDRCRPTLLCEAIVPEV